MSAIRPRTAAIILTSLFALALAVELLWMPVQLFDVLNEMLDAQASSSAWASFDNGLWQTAYLRPMRLAQIKMLFDLAGGEHYWLVYRGFHALLIGTALLLFVTAQRVSTRTDLIASAFALVVLVGLRTFRGGVQEAYPVNHFLEMVVFCLLTLNLARSRGGWWADIGALLTFGVAALTLESGLLVWVVAVTAWAVGWRGISSRGVAAMTALVAGYAYLRFVVVSAGLPGLSERSSGFLLAVLDPPELQQYFGDQVHWFYAYNVVASAFAVLFSEPSGGVFLSAVQWLDGDLRPRVVIPIVTSTLTTMLVVWAAARRLRPSWNALRQGRGVGPFLDDTGRFCVLATVVLAANAAVSYAYTKDEIMGVAGAFYALAAYAGMREALLRLESLPRVAAVAVVLTACALTVGWTVRAAGTHYILRTQAFKHQNDWAQLPGRLSREAQWPAGPAARALIGQLYDAATRMELPNTRLRQPRWIDRIWEE